MRILVGGERERGKKRWWHRLSVRDPETPDTRTTPAPCTAAESLSGILAAALHLRSRAPAPEHILAGPTPRPHFFVAFSGHVTTTTPGDLVMRSVLVQGRTKRVPIAKIRQAKQVGLLLPAGVSKSEAAKEIRRRVEINTGDCISRSGCARGKARARQSSARQLRAWQLTDKHMVPTPKVPAEAAPGVFLSVHIPPVVIST